MMVKERKRMLSVTITKRHDWTTIFEVVNNTNDTISWIEMATTYETNSLTDSVDVFVKLRMKFNDFYDANTQERNSADWLFSNLSNVIGYDLSEVLNVDESRINDILPINVKLQRLGKENLKCQKN